MLNALITKEEGRKLRSSSKFCIIRVYGDSFTCVYLPSDSSKYVLNGYSFFCVSIIAQ